MVEGPIWAAFGKGKARKKIAKYSFSVIYFNEPQFSGPTTSANTASIQKNKKLNRRFSFMHHRQLVDFFCVQPTHKMSEAVFIILISTRSVPFYLNSAQNLCGFCSD